MRLTLAIHPVHSITLGGATRLEGTGLTVNGDELKQLILKDTRLCRVDLAVASSGETCRIGVVSDIVEPRAKGPGSGSDFPGVVGPMAVAGVGTTHVLRGAAVTVLDEGAPLQNGKVLEMTGPAGARSPYSSLEHLVIVPHAAGELARHSVLNAHMKTQSDISHTLSLRPMPLPVRNVVGLLRTPSGPVRPGRRGIRP